MCWICDAKTSTPTASCASPWSPRRAFLLAAGAAVAAPALAQVNVGRPSGMRELVPAETLENAAQKQYGEVLAEARSKGTLASDNDPRLQRLRGIARYLIPNAAQWNARAGDWKWEVNLITSKEVNAWCMPGGKIAFYTGIIDQLKLTDDEIAVVMGHEMAHALREHAREQLAKTQATSMGLSLAAQLFGLGQLGDVAADLGTQLLGMKYSRDDESEADVVGLEISARGGYRPDAAISLWNKMIAANGKGGPSFLSTHPNSPDRIRQLEANIPKVQGLYEQARRP